MTTRFFMDKCTQMQGGLMKRFMLKSFLSLTIVAALLSAAPIYGEAQTACTNVHRPHGNVYRQTDPRWVYVAVKDWDYPAAHRIVIYYTAVIGQIPTARTYNADGYYQLSPGYSYIYAFNVDVCGKQNGPNTLLTIIYVAK